MGEGHGGTIRETTGTEPHAAGAGASTGAESHVRAEIRGSLGVVTLDRPRAINALSHRMIIDVQRVLDDWADDDRVRQVLVTGAGERGLCAGGDIVELVAALRTGDLAEVADYWADEYRLDAFTARSPKPVVALQAGIVLGGGIGVSGHARHRVVTDGSRLGMPETAIGFAPDVGGLWLLSRAPGELGAYAALTGAHFEPGDAVLLGLSERYVPAERIDELVARLERESADEVLDDLATEPPAGPLEAARGWIDDAFSASTAREVVERLRAAGVPDAAACADLLESRSPFALEATLAALRRARELLSLEAELDQAYRVSLRAVRRPDFAEGVRAQVIDKDRSPRWSPATLAEVDLGEVEALFAPFDDPADELGLAGG